MDEGFCYEDMTPLSAAEEAMVADEFDRQLGPYIHHHKNRLQELYPKRALGLAARLIYYDDNALVEAEIPEEGEYEPFAGIYHLQNPWKFSDVPSGNVPIDNGISVTGHWWFYDRDVQDELSDWSLQGRELVRRVHQQERDRLLLIFGVTECAFC